MHRAALRVPLRHAISLQRRSFVSTVLLTKAWENETTNELRKEARKRGLSASGNKATLVTRLQQHDQKQVLAPQPTPGATQARRASTSTDKTETPTEVPGIPSTAEPTHPKYNLDIKIPDAKGIEAEEPVQIPFVPDFWDSSKKKQEAAASQPAPSSGPKVVVIGGDSTLPGEGLYAPTASSSASAEQPRPEPKTEVGKLLSGMADDLGLPTTFKTSSHPAEHYDGAAQTESFGGQQKSYSRTLDTDEKKGLWVLFGVFAGSLAASGLLAPTSEWAPKKEKEEVVEKAKGENKSH